MTPRAALEKHLADWIAAQSAPLPVAWKNVGFTPPSVESFYLEPSVMPAARAGETFCGNVEIGVLQISIRGPRDVDVGPFEAIAEALCAWFAAGEHTDFKVVSPPYYSQGINTDDGRFLVPVTVNYRADSP